MPISGCTRVRGSLNCRNTPARQRGGQREKPIQLASQYALSWHPYSNIALKRGQFRYLTTAGSPRLTLQNLSPVSTTDRDSVCGAQMADGHRRDGGVALLERECPEHQRGAPVHRDLHDRPGRRRGRERFLRLQGDAHDLTEYVDNGLGAHCSHEPASAPAVERSRGLV